MVLVLRPVRVPGPGGLSAGEQGGPAATGKAPELTEQSASRVWGGGEVRAGGRVSRWGGPWRPAEHGEVRTTFPCARPHLHASGSPTRHHRVCLRSAERVADAGGRQVPAAQPVMATARWPHHRREQRAPRP